MMLVAVVIAVVVKLTILVVCGLINGADAILFSVVVVAAAAVSFTPKW